MADSDTDVKRSCGKRRKSQTLDSSSEDETTPISLHTPQQTRHSERLQSRKSKFSRRLSRDQQWNSISSEQVSPTCLSRLKPRKLINNFTKVTHRYNYDPAETSGEESIDDFINDSTSSSDSDSSSRSTKVRKREHRVKGYRSRIANVESDTSAEEDQDSDAENGNRERLKQSSTVSSEHQVHQRKVNTGQVDNQRNSPTEDSDSQEVSTMKTPRRGNRKVSVLDSDSDEELNSPPKPFTESDMCSEGTPGTSQVGTQTHDSSVKVEPQTSTESSDSESSASDSEDSSVGRIQKLAQLKGRRQNAVFAKLKDARAKKLKIDQERLVTGH